MTHHPPLSVSEVFGLTPYEQTLRQAIMVFRGDPTVPPSRFDLTSLNLMTPRLSIGTWLGKKMGGRTIPLLNLFNHNPTPPSQGWSVRVSQVRDFRGRALTYDSHNGTDFVIPPGTLTTAAAPGRIVSIRKEFNRGGLKIYIDHGHGLMTTHNHLARSLVEVGQQVAEGQPIALTGYSGIDGLTAFPWLAPHVHYNVILGGELVDPFALPGQTSLWKHHNTPKPHSTNPPTQPNTYQPTHFEQSHIDALLNDIKDPHRRTHLTTTCPPWALPFELIIEATIYPTRFSTPNPHRLLFPTPPKRQPRLSLPFLESEFDGIGFADEMGFRKAP